MNHAIPKPLLTVPNAATSTPEIQQQFGRYVELFKNKILGNEFSSVEFDVLSSNQPCPIDACAGYLITGSDASVYEQSAWIQALGTFVRMAAERNIPIVGICFGHQLIANIFGGQVIKDPKGWGLGCHTYDVSQTQPWMDRVPAISLLASHQDQVVIPPPQARVILSNSFTPFAGLAYTQAPVISFQAHPEFFPAYAAALLRLQTGFLPQTLVDRALASIESPNDSDRVISWIRRFLRKPIAAI